jgi:hypothetical protein
VFVGERDVDAVFAVLGRGVLYRSIFWERHAAHYLFEGSARENKSKSSRFMTVEGN